MNLSFTKWYEPGIRERVFALLLIIFIPFLLLEIQVYSKWFQERKEFEKQANLELARSVAKNFETFLQGVVSDELAVGLAITASRSMTVQDRDRLLDELKAGNPAVRSIFWIDAEGRVEASSLRDYIGFDLQERSFFRSVVKEQDWALSELFVGWSTDIPAFTVSRAVRNAQGELLGVVGAAIEPERLDRFLAVGRWADAGVSLIDNRGMHVFSHPPMSYEWEERNWLALYPVLEGALQGREVMADLASAEDGGNRLAAFVPVASTGWVVACSRAERDITAAIIQTLLPQMGLTFLVTLVGFAAAVGVSRPITRSILKLRDHAAAVGRGEMTHIEPDGPVEIKKLAGTLNEMAAEIRSRESALRESESLYRAMAGNFPEGAIFVFDHDLRFRVADGEALATMGVCRETLEGKSVGEAADAQLLQVLAAHYPKVLAGESFRLETIFKERAFSSAYVPIRDGQRNIIAGMSVCLDITERKRAERQRLQWMQMSQALNRISAAVHATLDSDAIMQVIMTEGAAVLGSETAVSLVRGGRRFLSRLADTIPELAIDPDRCALAFTANQPIAVNDVCADDRIDGDYFRRLRIRSFMAAPLVIRGASEGVLFFNYHTAPHRFTSAEIDFMHQMANIAGIALSNARLFKELEQSNQELNEFSYALTHNLKAPLRAIHNYAAFLSEDLNGTLSGEIRQYLEGLVVAVKQGNDQIADLETLYRIKSHEVSPEAIDMDEVFGEMQSIFQDNPEHQLVAMRPCPELWGERFLVRQILIELIRNGFKFNESQPKRVEIGCRPAEGNPIEIYVQDNGIGIAPQHREQIFRIFQRLHTASEYEGTGIGLAIVKRAVQKMGGTLTIASTVGQGSCFGIRLPRR